MMFELKIDTDNAAFAEAGTGTELATILRGLAERLDESSLPNYAAGTIRDGNGNIVGAWSYVP
jgi:hypothetical protein